MPGTDSAFPNSDEPYVSDITISDLKTALPEIEQSVEEINDLKESDQAFSQKDTDLQNQITNHNHDNRYPTKAEFNQALANKPSAKLSVGTGQLTGVLVGGGTMDVSINISPAMPDNNYVANAFISGASGVSVLGTLQVAVKSKSTSSVVVTAKNTGLLAIASGTIIEVSCTKNLT